MLYVYDEILINIDSNSKAEASENNRKYWKNVSTLLIVGGLGINCCIEFRTKSYLKG